ncbi:hypothetical protein [Burkholderia gladioli]|uniref:hypothetical protein n=1 Tax=Burkholderia gladioli TaxID=28095 RepID=UPI00164047E0|nr:hypothetical protein [Burkholderia gladioli]
MKFNFALGADVAIDVSHEKGLVVGRAEYVHGEPTYYVRYRSHTGEAREAWWSESALVQLDEFESVKPERVL